MGLNPFAEPYSSLENRHNPPPLSLHPPPRPFSGLSPPPPPPVLLPLPPPPVLLPLPPPPPPPPVRLPPPPPILFSLFPPPPPPPPPPVQLYLLPRPQKLVFSKLPRKHVLPLPPVPPPPPQPSPPQFTYRVRLQRRSKQQVKNLVWRMRAADKNHMEKNGEMQTTNLTTLMIRNIPNRMTREMLILMLDQHCREENEKHQELVLLQVEEEGEEAMKSEFDFVYLPIDFKTEMNLGYAFVNFTSAIAAAKFQASFDNFNWNVFGSSKICKISPARIQGKVQLVMRFRHSCFKCCKEEFLPVLFNRPRNGTTSLPPPTNVGRVRRRRS